MATQVETLLHTTSTTTATTPGTPSPSLQEDDPQPLAGHGELSPEPSSKQAGEESSPQDKKEFREAPPPKVNPWTKKLNAVTVNGQAAGEPRRAPRFVLGINTLHTLLFSAEGRVCIKQLSQIR